jgi:hypothetical protein
LQAAGELLADGAQPEAAMRVVQRRTLGHGQDGDVLGEPGVLQIRNPAF